LATSLAVLRLFVAAALLVAEAATAALALAAFSVTARRRGEAVGEGVVALEATCAGCGSPALGAA
jgi:hypothetical protein